MQYVKYEQLSVDIYCMSSVMMSNLWLPSKMQCIPSTSNIYTCLLIDAHFCEQYIHSTVVMQQKDVEGLNPRLNCKYDVFTITLLYQTWATNSNAICNGNGKCEFI